MHRFGSATLIDRRGWVLLQERDEHPVIDPEKWGFPGGSVEGEESYQQAAYRELAEETGVRLDPAGPSEQRLREYGRFLFWSESCGQEDEFELWVGATALSEVECHEGRQMVFVDPAVALGLPLTASAALVLPDLLASDLYRELAEQAAA